MGISRTTADRWWARYQQLGQAGLVDRPSVPAHSPRRTPPASSSASCGRAGVSGSARTGSPPGSACRLHRPPGAGPAWLQPVGVAGPPDRPVRRYEHDRPGDLVHLDVKKLGRIPAGGGHRMHGRAAETMNRRADPPAQTQGPGWPATGPRPPPTALRSTAQTGATCERRQGPREPRERGGARGRLAPSGKDPANPARPFRGAGSCAGSGGLAAAAARPAGGQPALAGFGGGDCTVAGPPRRGPQRPPGAGGPLPAVGWITAQGPHRPRLSGCHVIQRERPQPVPGMSIPVPGQLRRPEPRWRPLDGRFPTRPDRPIVR
jgi:hypothetical protein